MRLGRIRIIERERRGKKKVNTVRVELTPVEMAKPIQQYLTTRPSALTIIEETGRYKEYILNSRRPYVDIFYGKTVYF